MRERERGVNYGDRGDGGMEGAWSETDMMAIGGGKWGEGGMD